MKTLERWVFHGAMRGIVLAHRVASALASALSPWRRRPLSPETPRRILLTATFHSDNWIGAHLRPLAASRMCAEVRMVATRSLPAIDRVVPVYPNPLLRRFLGDVPARLLVFAREAFRTRPDVVGGFHLLFNGLWAGLVARLVGARSLYFSVGGIAEVKDGGVGTENRLSTRMGTPDRLVERLLLRAVSDTDLTITMGKGAKHFFEYRGVRSRLHVIGGGIEPHRFHPATEPPVADMIYVGRLAAIKRPEVFLRAVALVAREIPGVKAQVAGDGHLRESLDRLAGELCLGANLEFLGPRGDVDVCLRRSRILVNTSDSEGLPLSVMEAMMCGLPVVASHVGDMAELVEDGVNGFLIDDRTPENFAGRVVELLRSPDRLAAFSAAAIETARPYETPNAALRWDGALSDLA